MMNKLSVFFTSTIPTDKNRVEGLDLLRSIAIVFVVCYHAWAFISPYIPQVGQLFFLGFWGVEFFFVLSGFLVGGIFIRTYKTSEILTANVLLNFWKRRWKRTIPIYLIILLSSYLCLNYIYHLNIDIPFRYFFFTQNLWYLHPRFFPEAWSLAVEEWFYIMLPLVFVGFSYLFKGKSDRSIISIIILSILLLSSVRLVWLGEAFDIVYWDNYLRKIVLCRLDAILYGVLMYQLFEVYKKLFEKYRYVMFMIGVLGVACSYYFFHQKIYNNYNHVFFLSSTSVSISLCLPFFYFFKFKYDFFKSLVTLIALSSYTMYLIHYTLLFRFINSGLVTQGLAHAIGMFVFYLLLVFVVSLVVYRFVERPLTKR